MTDMQTLLRSVDRSHPEVKALASQLEELLVLVEQAAVTTAYCDNEDCEEVIATDLLDDLRRVAGV